MKINEKIITVLFYNTMFEEPLDIPKNIDKRFKITTDKSFKEIADVVVFHMPNLRQIPYDYKPANQLWVSWSLESDVNYPFLMDNKIMQYFDLKMTYRLDSEVPQTYLYKRYHKSLRNPPKRKTKGINTFISSPFNQSGRLEYFSKLLKHSEIDSFGKIFNNSKLPFDDGSHEAKEQLIADYKFTIAFENSISKDYVTEKFFQPLAVGSVPIYLGAPNINDFAPGKNCFINVNDFKSVEKLSTYIDILSNNDKLYDEYFQWKQAPFASNFEKLLEIESKHIIVRLIEKIGKTLNFQ